MFDAAAVAAAVASGAQRLSDQMAIAAAAAALRRPAAAFIFSPLTTEGILKRSTDAGGFPGPSSIIGRRL